MVEKVVYLLGAGFSAPLGLPVMSNFLTRAKDLYADDPLGLAHFHDVFKTIKQISELKNYYHADLHNIEEILSILTMQDYASNRGRTKRKALFVRFLADVVQRTTPQLNLPQYDDHFSGTQHAGWGMYLAFVLNLLSLSYKTSKGDTQKPSLVWEQKDRPQTRYGIITLNYDCVIETVFNQMMKQKWQSNGKPILLTRLTQNSERGLPLAKLHGCASNNTIVPPTWQKGDARDVQNAWMLAHKLLNEANQIRILGYSLPETDAYMKYLLKSAAVASANLKRIDVICLDDGGGTVSARYSRLFSSPNYRYFDGDVATYLRMCSRRLSHMLFDRDAVFADLEDAHQRFMLGQRE